MTDECLHLTRTASSITGLKWQLTDNKNMFVKIGVDVKSRP